MGWWTTFTLRRTGLAFAISLVIVPLLAVVSKAVVEAATSLVYEIHWFETVPFIVVGFTLVINRLLNERHGKPRAAGPA